MTTYQDLIHETRHYLMTAQPDRLNVLSSTIDDSPSTTTVQFTHDLKGVNEGTVLCIGLEEMHVLSVGGLTAGSTAEVIRAINGSTIASHTLGDRIQVAPQFSDFRISKYINSSIEDISGEGLFRINSVDFDWVPSISGYNLNTPGLIDVWRVRYKTAGPLQDWPVLRPDQYRIDQAADTDDFPEGVQIVLYQPAYPGFPVRVSYRRGFNPLATLADDVLVVSGLHTEAHDILSLGAALDLLAGREIKRTFLNRQPEPRRQEEVPTGSIQRSALGIMEHYRQRIVTEVRRLNRRYPPAH